MSYRRQFDADEYDVEYLKLHRSESFVQQQVLNLLVSRGIQAWPVDSGAKQMRASAGFYGRASAAVEKGCSDIIGCIPWWGGRMLCLEIKAPQWLGISPKTGRLIQDRAAGAASPEQLAFLDRMQAAGALVGIAWSVEDAEQILEGE